MPASAADLRRGGVELAVIWGVHIGDLSRPRVGSLRGASSTKGSMPGRRQTLRLQSRTLSAGGLEYWMCGTADDPVASPKPHSGRRT